MQSLLTSVHARADLVHRRVLVDTAQFTVHTTRARLFHAVVDEECSRCRRVSTLVQISCKDECSWTRLNSLCTRREHDCFMQLLPSNALAVDECPHSCRSRAKTSARGHCSIHCAHDESKTVSCS